MKNSIAYIILCCTIAMASCEGENRNPKQSFVPYTLDDDIAYSFFVAGHAYGNPMNFQYGLHPPFKTLIPEINNYPKLALGVFTGDVVPKPTEAYWDSAAVDLAKFKVPIHIAPGNHDKSEEFYKRYPDYYSFNHANDLFLILSPKSWNIEGEQLEMVKNSIDSCKSKVDNVFIFCHELIWWSPDNEFGNVEINYRPHFPGSISYWDDFQPYLDSLETPVFLMAGDIGAADMVDPYMYEKQNNITYIASGMGSRINDNMLFVEVTKAGDAEIKMIGVKDAQFGLIQKFGAPRAEDVD